MQDYKTLKVWQKSHYLVLDVYEVSKSFPKEEMFALTTQLKRACYSIPSNIAEGCGKHSQADLAKFLQIRLGSANEVEYFFLLCRDLNYIEDNTYEGLVEKINEIRAMLIKLIQKVRS